MLREIELYHGAALAYLLRQGQGAISFELLKWDRSFNSYCVGKRRGVYLKYSTKRLPPWRFAFTDEQVKEFRRLREAYSDAVIGLICGNDGIVGLDDNEVRILLGEECAGGWISVQRGAGKQYRVEGSQGTLKGTIGRQSFARKALASRCE